jgi:hypothetical protein
MVEKRANDMPRRSLLSRLGFGLAAASLAAGAGRAQAQPAGAWRPAAHSEDDWFDQPSAKHRFVFDTTTPMAAGGALLYASNFFAANKSGYNLDPRDLSVVIILRHFSTPFAYTDAIWSKYGTQLSEILDFTDPKTKQAPRSNVYVSGDYGFALPNLGNTFGEAIQRGVRFAVCDMATHFFAANLASKTGGNADAIYRELTGNLLANAHMVPAGIVAVNRAQERGFTFAYVA